MLEELDVQPDWTWEQYILKAMNHPMYKCLKTVNDRKSVFETYAKDLGEKRKVMLKF
jgi:hypothetical protein